MTLFLLLIWWVGREFIDAVDFIRQLSHSIHWRFQVQQGLCFRWWFMDQQWNSVFDNSMHQPWLYFFYWFDVSIVNSLTLLITYIGSHSVFINNFKFNRNFVFADDLWISSVIAFFSIAYISHYSIFAIDLIHRSWIHWHCRFHTSPITVYSLTI
jgi:hypothetical protein